MSLESRFLQTGMQDSDGLLEPAEGEKGVDTELAGKINFMAGPVQPPKRPHVLDEWFCVVAFPVIFDCNAASGFWGGQSCMLLVCSLEISLYLLVLIC